MQLVTCRNNIDNPFIIDGDVDDAEEGEMACLSYPEKQGETWKWQRDTIYVKDGKFRFGGNINDLRSALLSFLSYSNG